MAKTVFWIVWLYNNNDIVTTSIPFDDEGDALVHAETLKGRKGVTNVNVIKRSK